MDPNLIDENIKLKTSLVQTRKTIRDKYRKLHNEKKIKKRELEERYQPITNTLQKLIDVKNKNKKKTHSQPSENENHYGEDNWNANEDDVSMLSIDEEPTIIGEESTNIGDEPTNLGLNRVKIKRPRDSDIGDMSTRGKRDMRIKTETNSRRNSRVSIKSEPEVMNDSMNEINTDLNAAGPSNQQQASKRNRESDDVKGLNPTGKIKKFFNDILRKGSVEKSKSNINNNDDDHDDHDDGDNTSIISDQSKRKKMQKMVNELNVLHDIRKTGLVKYRAKNTPRNLDDESLIVVSPQDYDELGKFRGPGVKRSKHAVPEGKWKKTVQKLARKTIPETPKRRNAKKVEKSRADLKTKENPEISWRKFRKKNPGKTWRQVINRVTPSGKIKKVKTDLIRDDLKRQILSKKARHGAGLVEEFVPYTDNITYEYYDDPNELCERLMLLVSSKSAGNSNHSQEINSIIEELRERGVIV